MNNTLNTSENISENTSEKRLTLVNLMAATEGEENAGQDVIEGLSASPQKTLPPKYFYDVRGAQLVELICELPEYYPTRTETGILKEFGSAIAHTTGPCEIVELGSGSSTKTRILLNAYQAADYPLRYLPIDVSDTMLNGTADKLLEEYSALSIYAIASTYEPALQALPPKQLPARLIAFLGSTIGNLSPSECDDFLSRIESAILPGDYFLLGLDLQKETSILEAAYNDTEGVTAAFNLNMLQHLNQKFDGNFNLDNFAHAAQYSSQDNRIEMYLKSLTKQTVQLKKLPLTVEFEKGDRIRSEISRKFSISDITQRLAAHQLNVLESFTDKKQWFGLLLCQRAL